ncbi:MAG: PLP-dependent transferase, partial [Eudoraea sp.]|uniref:PLP-dependent transferase n=1 Tax=Eudoraea sp. TaxID=1979955 RepID=UPI003C70734F
SIKTMGIRVKSQNENAMRLAEYLDKNADIKQVNYPGLTSHPDHALAKSQMNGFGGMLSFELKESINATDFRKALKLIKSSMSLAGIESTVLSPTQTSHALLSAEDRYKQGIADGLIRFSLGIEEPEDLIADIEQALERVKAKQPALNNQ